MTEEEYGGIIVEGDSDGDDGDVIERVLLQSERIVRRLFEDEPEDETEETEGIVITGLIRDDGEENIFDDDEDDDEKIDQEYGDEREEIIDSGEKEPILHKEEDIEDFMEEERLEKMRKQRAESGRKKLSGRGRFDCKFCIRFTRIIFCHLGCFSFVQPLLIILIFILSIALTGIGFYKAKLIGDFFVYFVEDDYSKVWETVLILAFLQLASGVCSAFMSFGFIQLLLYYFWRKTLTLSLLQQYFMSKNYYVILHKKDKTIDNPDQRIQEDVRDFCFSLSLTLVGVIQNSINVVFFFAVMIYYKAYLLLIPVFLWPPINICCYGICFTPLASQVFKKDAAEGDFRFSHARIREFSESIAFYKSSNAEKGNVVTQFKKVVKISVGLAVRRMFLNGWTVFSAQMPQMTILFFLLIMVFANMPPFHEDMKTEDISGDVNKLFQIAKSTTDSLGSLFAIAGTLTVVIGNTARIGEMFETFDSIRKSERRKSKKKHVFEDETQVRFENVTTETLAGKVLHKGLNFAVTKDRSVIIMGPSGCGKSSLLRQLAGLWETYKGEIHKPSKVGRNGMFFLPQRPYLVRGTLKDNIVYPFRSDEVHCSDERLIEVLKLANVDYILSRASLHEVNVCWDEKLSLGEQQRVAISRLFLHKPRFAVMDESTSALDPMNEERVYFNLKNVGITLISVAHRKSVMKYHDYVLNLSDQTTHEFRKIEKEEIPVYDYEWVKLAKHVANPMERDGLETDEIVDQEMEDNNVGGAGINMLFVRRLVHLFIEGILVRKWCDCCFMTFVIVFAFINSLTLIPIVIFTGTINSSIASRKVGLAIMWSSLVLVAIGVMVLVSLLNDFFFALQGIMFRKNLVTFLHRRYFDDQRYYEINILTKTVDNADQRICQDADFLTSGFETQLGLSFIEKMLFGSIVTFLLLLLSTDTNGSQMIMLICILVLFVVVFGQGFILYFLSKVQFLQQKKEGYFRYFLTRLKEYSEQIAFYEGKYVEKQLIEEKFHRVNQNLLKYVLIQSIATSYVAICYNVSSILGYFLLVFTAYLEIVDVSSMSSEDAIGMLTMKNLAIQLAFVGMLGVLSSSNMFGVFSGNVSRVSQFIEKMEDLERKKYYRENQHLIDISKNDSDDDNILKTGSINNQQENIIPRNKRLIPKYDDRIETLDYIKIENLTAITPNHKKFLFYDLDIHIEQTHSVVIVGPSGCGKSSLLRILSGLWPTGVNGRIFSPQKIGNGGIFFVPQKPYLIPGTSLRSQIIYPDTESNFTDSELLSILKKVNLEYLIHRFDMNNNNINFCTILSPGEQQRLGVARILYHKPLFCLLDESTSALDEENEEIMMKALKGTRRMSIISIGHRKSLLKYHQYKLSFDGGGGWTYERKNDFDDEEDEGEISYDEDEDGESEFSDD